MGIDQGTANGWSNDTDISLTESTNSVSGSTTSDMAVWNTTDSNIGLLEELANGVITSQHQSYQTIVGAYGSSSMATEDFHGMSKNADAEDGFSQNDMDVWTNTREELLDAFGSASVFEATYGLPHGFVDTPENPFSNVDERGMGATLSGGALSPDGVPLEGSVKLVDTAEDEQIGSGPVSGTFIGSAGVVDGVIEGGNVGAPDVSSLRWEFTPEGDSVPVSVDNVLYPHEVGFSARYGYAEGYVEEYDGTPAGNETVSVEGSNVAAVTDEDGKYQLLLPGGYSATLTSLQGTASVGINVVEFESTQEDFVYPALEVSVAGPFGEPASDVPVIFGNEEIHTNEKGTVLFGRVPLGDYSVQISGVAEEDFSLTSQGQLEKVSYQGGSRVDIIVEDYEIGDPIQDIVAIEKEDGYVSYSGDTGVISVVFVGSGEFKLEVAPRSNRYTKKVINVGVGEDEVKGIKSQLQRDIATTNR